MLINQLSSIPDKELQDKITKARKMLMFHTQMGHHDRITEVKSYVDMLEQESYNRLLNKAPASAKKKKKKILEQTPVDQSLEFGDLNIGNLDDKPEW